MSHSQNLRRSMADQIIDDMTRGHIPSPFPSQSALVEMYNISRTTVHHVLSHLDECGMLTRVDNHYVIVRKSNHDNGSAYTTASMTEQDRIFEQAFSTMINQRQPHAGESSSELQLARATGVSPVVVREYLLKFKRYNLIKNEKRGQWNVKQSNQAYAERLFELREMLETHSLQHFLNLSDDGPRRLQAKTLLERHRILRGNTGNSFRMFLQLDRKFHALLFSVADNVFFNQSFEIISVAFHFHYQWGESDLKQRNIIVINEHMAILSALVCRSDLDVALALCNHLNSARQSMIRFISQGCNVAH